MRRNFRRLRLHEPGPQNRVARKQWIPAKAYSNLSNHCQTWGCPTLALRGPCRPLLQFRACHRCHRLQALLRRISTYSSQPRRRASSGPRRLDILLVDSSSSPDCLSRPVCPPPELGAEIPSTGPRTLEHATRCTRRSKCRVAGCRWLTAGEALDLGVYAVTGHRHSIESHSSRGDVDVRTLLEAIGSGLPHPFSRVVHVELQFLLMGIP